MNRRIDLKWWQLALISIAVSFLGSLSGGKKKKDERKVYEKELEQAPWAPPAWVFAPAWTLNNFFLLQGLQKLLMQKDLPTEKRLLVMQAFIWLIFFSFNYIYFNRKSSVLAAVWTVADAALAGTSFGISHKKDKKLSYSYLPLLIWTGYASTIAVYQALKNPDPVLDTPAVL